MTDAIKVDLYSQDFRRHAYETFSRLRQESPVFRTVGLDGETPIWFVTRFEDIETMRKDDHHFVVDYRLALDASQLPPFRQGPEVMDRINHHLLTKDGEDHRRLRSLVTKAFTPRRISDMRPRIQAVANDLIDRVESQKQMDLIESYAFPLPIVVIAELLGVPAADRHKFREWSDIFVRPAFSAEEQNQFLRMAMEFVGYLQTLFEERRKNPKDDLISALLQAEEAGDRLGTQELYSMVVLLIVAGHETTVSLIGNATVALLTHPDVLERLKQHPEEMPKAVEEFLRFDPPVERTITRFVTADVVLGGQHLKRGELVIAILGSGNRDESEFGEADRLNIDRDNRAHLAFGRGVHYCLGAPLARLEGEIALNTLLRRLPGLQLAADRRDLEFRMVPLFHAFTRIPVRWE